MWRRGLVLTAKSVSSEFLPIFFSVTLLFSSLASSVRVCLDKYGACLDFSTGEMNLQSFGKRTGQKR